MGSERLSWKDPLGYDVRFRRIDPGLYGTNVRYPTDVMLGDSYVRDYRPIEAELVLDRMGLSWWAEREILTYADGAYELTSYLGEGYSTLRDAKADIVRRYGNR